MLPHLLLPVLRPSPTKVDLPLQLLQVAQSNDLGLELLLEFDLLLAHGLGHVLLMPPIRDLASLSLLLQFLLIPGLYLI